MRVAFVLLSLLSLLAFAPLPCSSLGADLLRFRTVTTAAQWPGRRQAFVRQLTGIVGFRTDRGALSYTNPLVLMGGFVPEWADDYNDVWLSSDGGRSWALGAGVTVDGDMAGGTAAETSFPTAKNNGANFALLPSTGAIVRLSQEVTTTSNLITWREQSQFTYEPRNLATLVATSRGTLIRAAGQEGTPNFAFRNDVVVSVDAGRTWRTATENAPWSARFVNTMLTTPSSIDGGKDVTYIIAGRDTVDNYNDVWASSDDGKTWTVISAQGPFMTRASANGAVTKDGLLILAGGFADEDLGASNTAIANDVWLSMNGGYTWGRCVLDAEWDDRFQQAVAVDADGYLMILGGATGDVASSYVLNDVWRSTTSFHDLPAIARACGLAVPSCGTGLKCWPGAGTVVATDGSFVSCSACPEGGVSMSASAANSTALIAALAVFVILFVGTAVLAAYIWNKLQQASKGGPASFGSTSFASADTNSLIGSDHHL